MAESYISRLKEFGRDMWEYYCFANVNYPPNLNIRDIINEIQNDPVFTSERFVSGEISLRRDVLSPMFNQYDQVKLVQRALIVLDRDLMNIDIRKEHWWKTPRSPYSDSEVGVAWGSYGPRTATGVKKLQNFAGMSPVNNGQVFGRDSLVVLIAALHAKLAGKDWKKTAEKTYDSIIKARYPVMPIKSREDDAI